MAKQLGPSPLITLPDEGTIDTYETGASTTTKATYHELDGEARHQNPIGVDSTYSALVYLDEDVEYRFVIKDEDGSTTHTIDNINPIVDPTRLTRNLDVNGSSIVSSSAGNISITPDGVGFLILDGLNWPRADGSAGYVLSTDGSGNLSWIANGSFWLPDLTPQLGGALDGNTYSIKFDDATGITDDSGKYHIKFHTTTSAINYIDITNAATGNGLTIAAAGTDTDIDLNLNGKGSGNVVLNGLSLPTTDGSANQVLQTDGSGNFSFGVYQADVASTTEVQSGAGSKIISLPDLNLHPGVPTAVVFWNSSGQYTYGIDSITTSGSHRRLTFTNPLASANYAVSAVTIQWDLAGATLDSYLVVHECTTTYVDLKMRRPLDSVSSTPTQLSVVVYGTLA